MEKLMLGEFIGHLQDTLKQFGDMPISKLAYYEEVDGESGFEVVDVGGFVVKEPVDGDVDERTLVILDDAEVDMLNLDENGEPEPEPTIQ